MKYPGSIYRILQPKLKYLYCFNTDINIPYFLPNILNIFHGLMQYCTCLVFILFWNENSQVSIFTEKLPLHKYHENILHVAFLTKIKQLSFWMFIQTKRDDSAGKRCFLKQYRKYILVISSWCQFQGYIQNCGSASKQKNKECRVRKIWEKRNARGILQQYLEEQMDGMC